MSEAEPNSNKVTESGVAQYTAALARHLYESYVVNSDGSISARHAWPQLTQGQRDDWCAVADAAQIELRAHWGSK